MHSSTFQHQPTPHTPPSRAPAATPPAQPDIHITLDDLASPARKPLTTTRPEPSEELDAAYRDSSEMRRQPSAASSFQTARSQHDDVQHVL